ncbi:MAG: hypothetical protein WCX88_03950, partial [Patescibacteria group bacterium]
MEDTNLTVIIPTLENELSARALRMCISSLEETCNSKIIVAENGEGTSYPQGQCKAVNRVAKDVTTEWILISNNDMVYSKNWFKELAYWVENMELLVASPNLVEPRRGAPPFLEHFCGGVGTIGAPADFKKQCFDDFVAGYSPLEPSSYSGKIPVEDGGNFPVLIRTDVFKEVGMYDTNYDPFSSNSDSDLFYKFLLAGIVPKRIKSSLVYHFSQVSGTFHPDNSAYLEK